MEEEHKPLTTQELIDQLYEQHDREVHELFSRLLSETVEVVDDKDVA